jgi:hypothetical protein
MRKVLVCALMVVAFVAGRADAQVLWEASKAGMTVDEVQAAFPSGEKVSPSAAELTSRDAVLYMVRNVELAGLRFDARFYFAKGNLVSVILMTAEPQPNTIAARIAAGKLRSALTAKYGAPLNRPPQSPRVTDWKSGTTTIVLVTTQWNLLQGSISIGYSAEPSP